VRVLEARLGHAALDLVEALLEQSHALGQHLRLVRQPRDDQREVQQHHEDEAERDDEQRRRRVEDPDRGRHPLEQLLPQREAQEDDRREEPEQRVALHQAPPAHELEDDHEERERRGDRDDLQAQLHG
jgi:hypothetical protein